MSPMLTYGQPESWKLMRLFPVLETAHWIECPADTCTPKVNLASAIVHLNDLHKWSREKIADWLETLPHDMTAKTGV